VADPILSIFMNTFLWRQSGDVTLIGLYNLGWVLGLPIGFIANGLLLRKIHVKYLYFFGTVLQGIGSALAIFSGVLTPLSVIIYGSLYGTASGFFWGNRNSLDFRLSHGRNRSFYNHLYYVVNLLLQVIAPIVIGWLIVSGEKLDLYSAESAYKVLLGLALLSLTVSGSLVAVFPMPRVIPKKLFMSKPSKHWRQVRLFNVLFNLMWGINFFLPASLILYFGSKEGILGTLQSVAALLAAGVMYILGRKTHIKYAPRTVLLANVLYLLSCLFLIWQFSWLGAAVYLITVMIVSPIRWSASYTVIMEIMDGEDGVLDGEADYAVVLDNELMFNLGRSLSIVFLLVMVSISLEGALKWVPLVMAVTQFGVLLPLRRMVTQALRAKIS